MIFGLLRVKNEARWIERVVTSILPICKDVLILDDHSTDQTAAICHRAGCRVYPSPFDNFDEGRDKEYLLQKVWECGARLGDYCFQIDGDEELHPSDKAVVESYAFDGRLVSGSVAVYYLWNTFDQIRIDRWYSSVMRASLFKLTQRDLTFLRSGFGGNLHCSSVPVQLLDQTVPTPIRLLHYGYVYREDRIRKYHFYNHIDPENEFEDRYRHMVIGDLFPEESAFKWAGPLRLQRI